MTMQLIGFYHSHGYNIWLANNGRLVDQVYEAGNSPACSVTLVPVECGVSVETLKRYCEQTGREMAAEMGLTWIGCDEEVDPYDGLI